jgi:hypothetical protein
MERSLIAKIWGIAKILGRLTQDIAQDRGKTPAMIFRKVFTVFIENPFAITVIEFCQNMRGHL